MTLIENYLTQVSQLLPKEGRADILAELRQSLEEGVSTTHESGKTKRDAEIEALARLGHPIKVAGRYHPQQYLIGPAIFPAYRYLLGRVLVALLAVHLAVSLFLFPALETTLHMGDVIAHLLAVLCWGAFFITLGFVSVEYTGETLKFFDRWNAQTLQQASTRPLEFGDTAWNVLIDGLFLLWWNNILIFADSTHILPGPIWDDIFWPANVIVGLMFLLHLSLVVRGYWSRWALKTEIVLNLGILGILAPIAMADTLVIESTASEVPRRILINVIYGAVAAIALWSLWDIRKALIPLMRPL